MRDYKKKSISSNIALQNNDQVMNEYKSIAHKG